MKQLLGSLLKGGGLFTFHLPNKLLLVVFALSILFSRVRRASERVKLRLRCGSQTTWHSTREDMHIDSLLNVRLRPGLSNCGAALGQKNSSDQGSAVSPLS